jgi:hypothetical protein
MASDPGARQPDAAKPDFSLPDILDLGVRRIRFRPRELRNFESALAKHEEAVEFTVTTDGPIPIRALGPALYVGETAVVESEEIEPTVYRFLAFDPAALEPRAPIRLGWSGQAPGRRRTKFRYEAPEE